MRELDVLEFIKERNQDGETCAMVMIIEADGSAPRGAGAVMGVSQNQQKGTIGGGNLEKRAVSEARKSIRTREEKRIRFKLNRAGDLSMQCGGEAEVFIKIFSPKKRLIVAGCGHIGKELYSLSEFLNFSTVMIDNREEFAHKERFKNAEVRCGEIKDELKKIEMNQDDYVVVVTSGHKYDEESLRAVIEKNAKYIGMIGSKEKIVGTLRRIKDTGVQQKLIDRVHTPVGLDIADGSPKEIALAIFAEILKVKNEGSGEHMKQLKFGKMNFSEII